MFRRLSPLTRRPAPRDGDLSPLGRGVANRLQEMCHSIAEDGEG